MEGIDVGQDDINAAQEVLVELQKATEKAAAAINARNAATAVNDSQLLDNDDSDRHDGSFRSDKKIRMAMFFGYNGNGYHVRIFSHCVPCSRGSHERTGRHIHPAALSPHEDIIGACFMELQGMQVNPGVRTIEGTLHAALVDAGAMQTCADGGATGSRGSTTVSEDFKRCKWSRAARTDKGVSAAGQVVAFNAFMRPDTTAKLNAKLPEHIRIYGFKCDSATCRVPSQRTASTCI
jgi:hypothetical protein